MARNDSVASAWNEARALLAMLPQLVSGRVRLLSLELRRASGALALIAALGIAAALMLATAWLALWAAVAAALIEHGLGWGWAVLIVALVNLAGAGVLLLKVKSLASLLTLPATVRRLGVVGATAAVARTAGTSEPAPMAAAAVPPDVTAVPPQTSTSR